MFWNDGGDQGECVVGDLVDVGGRRQRCFVVRAQVIEGPPLQKRLQKSVRETDKKESGKNIQHQGFAGRHRPNY